jgi:hypothetical protein
MTLFKQTSSYGRHRSVELPQLHPLIIFWQLWTLVTWFALGLNLEVRVFYIRINLDTKHSNFFIVVTSTLTSVSVSRQTAKDFWSAVSCAEAAIMPYQGSGA